MHVHHALLYLSLPSLHDYDVRLSNFTFCRGREHKTTTFFSFFWTLIQSFRIQLQKNSPTFHELNEHFRNTTESVCFNWKEAAWSLTKKKENKKEKLTQSLHLKVEMTRRSNYTLIPETLHKQSHCRNHKAALNEKPTDSLQWLFMIIRSSI